MTERRTDQDSADKKGHGAHGTSGFGQEQRVDDADVEPDMTADTESGGTRGDAGWGDQASGGSVIDKRKPNRKKHQERRAAALVGTGDWHAHA
jgi:hypothetical protein